ncbi:MAG: hypothetical protein ACRD2W_09395 [Acidimicrobiales bacterium]
MSHILPASEPDPPKPPPRRRGPLVLALVVAALVAAGLAAIVLRDSDDEGGEVGAGGQSSTTAAAAGPSTTVATTAPIPPAQKRIFDQMMAQVAEVRGLQWKGPLNLKVVSKSDLQRLVRDVTNRDVNPDQVAAEEATLKVLGLIPNDLDYRKLIEDLLAEQVLGFYDPETKELFVGGTGGDNLDAPTRFVIAHEMVHALTDQVFNFGPATIALDKADKAEESGAYSALLEGDATVAQELWAEKHLSAAEQVQALLGGGSGVSTFLRAPDYIQKSLLFPYDRGRTFVKGLYDAGGFAAVDAAYRKPPTSTEHILRPETYRAGQPSTSPALPNLASGTGCRGLRNGIIGQFDMRAVLDTHLSTADANRAADGWNGDAFGLVRCGSALGLADRWETDPGTDPARLVEALGRWSQQWSGSGRLPGADGRFSGSKGAGRIVRSGSRVDLVLAQDVDTMEKLVRALGS